MDNKHGAPMVESSLLTPTAEMEVNSGGWGAIPLARTGCPSRTPKNQKCWKTVEAQISQKVPNLTSTDFTASQGCLVNQQSVNQHNRWRGGINQQLILKLVMKFAWINLTTKLVLCSGLGCWKKCKKTTQRGDGVVNTRGGIFLWFFFKKVFLKKTFHTF